MKVGLGVFREATAWEMTCSQLKRGRRLDGEVSQARPCCSRCAHLGGSLNLAGALFDPATNLTEVR